MYVCMSPVEVKDVVEDFRVPVEEELVVLDDVVIAQGQLPAVVCVHGQPTNPCLWIPGCQPVGQVVQLPKRKTEEDEAGTTKQDLKKLITYLCILLMSVKMLLIRFENILVLLDRLKQQLVKENINAVINDIACRWRKG